MTAPDARPDTQRTIDAVWRIESARLIAGLARFAGDNDIVDALDNEIGGGLPRLVFTTCHPILSQEARVALTLRLLGGLTTDEIARAFLVGESTIAQGTNFIYPRALVYSPGTRAAGLLVALSAIPSAPQCPSTLSRSPT